jgi:hypothetical protein
MTVVENRIKFSILWAFFGSISTAASCTMIYVIFKSRSKLSTIRNRLLFGLSISDAILSLMIVLHTMPSPVDTPNTLWGRSYGNIITCNTQGFFFIASSLIGPFYNAMFTIYCLCVVKLNLSDGFIKEKIEPHMHLWPTIFSFAIASVAVSRDYINPTSTMCMFNASPEKCLSNPDVECERGDRYLLLFRVLAYNVPIYVCSLIVVASMTVIYGIVRKQEVLMSTKYRDSRQVQRTRSPSIGAASIAPSSVIELSNFLFRRPVSNSRTIIHRAIAHFLAFLLSYTFAGINCFILLTKGEYNEALNILTIITYPSQGLFNFIAFIFPKVTRQLRGNPEFNLWQGILAAIQCREIVPPRRKKNRVFRSGHDRFSSHTSTTPHSVNTTFLDNEGETPGSIHIVTELCDTNTTLNRNNVRNGLLIIEEEDQDQDQPIGGDIEVPTVIRQRSARGTLV